MGEKEKIQHEIEGLKNKLFALSDIKDECWKYHPSNPDFINPITICSKIKSDIEDINRKIEVLEFKLNSLN